MVSPGATVPVSLSCRCPDATGVTAGGPQAQTSSSIARKGAASHRLHSPPWETATDAGVQGPGLRLRLEHAEGPSQPHSFQQDPPTCPLSEHASASTQACFSHPLTVTGHLVTIMVEKNEKSTMFEQNLTKLLCVLYPVPQGQTPAGKTRLGRWKE
ncbi:unnamed protein product [Rangifer tarandus platyrhynchus]|uniref:Uncharacterized protein n=1 Tax=Rangifer tarandus platyrhynchus TaxID=3082113 RepID=A0ACB1MJF6_RANTA